MNKLNVQYKENTDQLFDCVNMPTEVAKALGQKVNDLGNLIVNNLNEGEKLHHMDIPEEEKEKLSPRRDSVIKHIIDNFSQEEVVLALFGVMESNIMKSAEVEVLTEEELIAKLTGTEIAPLEDKNSDKTVN